MIKYAIKVKMSYDDWMYVTGSDGKPVTYLSSEAAEDMAEVWRLTGKEGNVKVVVYKEVE